MSILARGTSSASATSNATTSMTVPVPSPAPQAGDLLVAQFEGAGNAQPTITPPSSGWTLVPNSAAYDAGTPGPYQATYTKRATGTDTAETWAWTATNGPIIALTAYYSNAGATVNVDQAAAAVGTGAGSTTRTTPTLTVAAGTLLVESHLDVSNSSWSGYVGTARHVLVRSASTSCLIADVTVSAAGTYSRTATASVATASRVDALLSLVETAATSNVTANAGADQTVDPNLVDTYDVSGAGSVGTSYVWKRNGVTLPGTTRDRTVPILKSKAGSTDTLTLTVSDGTTTVTDTVVVTVMPHARWGRRGGVDVPIRRK